MSNLYHEKKDELFYAVYHSSETPQVLDIEEPRLRLITMEYRYPSCQYICGDVKFGESRKHRNIVSGNSQKGKQKSFFASLIKGTLHWSDKN